MTPYEELVAVVRAASWPADPAECVTWRHGKYPDGVGRVNVDGNRRRVTRVADCLAAGIPLSALDGLVVAQRCGNSSCFRPSHLLRCVQGDQIASAAPAAFMNKRRRHRRAGSKIGN